MSSLISVSTQIIIYLFKNFKAFRVLFYSIFFLLQIKKYKISLFSQFFKSEVQLIYNVVLVSSVQQNDSVIHIYVASQLARFFFRFFSIIGYYKILSIVSCAIQQVLYVYLFYIQQCVYVNPKLLIYLSPLTPTIPFGNHKFLFYVCESIYCFVSFFK